MLGGEGLEALAVPAAHPAAPGADPEPVLAVFEQAAHHAAGQPIGGGEGLETAAIPAAHSAFLFHLTRAAVPDAGADPELSLAVFEQAAHPVVGQSVPGGEGLEALAIPAVHSAPGADPDLAVLVLEERAHADAGQTIGVVIGFDQTVSGGEGLEALAVETTQFVQRAYPQVSGLVLEQAQDDVVGQPVGGGVVLEPGSVIAAQAAAEGAEPQPALTVFEQGSHPVVGQPVGGGVGEQLGAVVAADAPFHTGFEPSGAQPQITVMVLQHGRDARGHAVGDPEGLPQTLAQAGAYRRGAAGTGRG